MLVAAVESGEHNAAGASPAVVLRAAIKQHRLAVSLAPNREYREHLEKALALYEIWKGSDGDGARTVDCAMVVILGLGHEHA